MPLPHFSIVDLGTKTGGSLELAQRALAVETSRPGRFFGLHQEPLGPVLAVERDLPERLALYTTKGWHYSVTDLDTDFPRCTADVWVASHILEHLASVERSIAVLAQMLQQARIGVWLRLPSFEQDELGEGALRPHGLRFYWTEWPCHSSHFTLAHVQQALRTCGRRKYYYRAYPRKTVHDSTHTSIVPISASNTAAGYEASMGPKPPRQFEPPLVTEWDVLIKWRKA